MKPVATGRRPLRPDEIGVFGGSCAVGDMINDDVVTIEQASWAGCGAADLNPYAFDWGVSPHIAAACAGARIDIEHIAAAFDRLAGRVDAVVVEGTGGWLAPIGDSRTMADVAQRLKLPVVLVVGLRLGCLNHALLSVQAIGASALTLAGWIGSVLSADMPALAQNIATLDAMLSVPRLALLPHARAADGDVDHVRHAADALFAAQPRGDRGAK